MQGTGLSAKPSPLLSGLNPTRPAGGSGQVIAAREIMPICPRLRFQRKSVLFR
jgi:hypothetical protein